MYVKKRKREVQQMYYDCLKDKMFDEALEQLEREDVALPNTLYYPVWNGKEWVYKPIKK